MAGLSFGVPEELKEGLPRLSGGGEALDAYGPKDRLPFLPEKKPRVVELAQFKVDETEAAQTQAETAETETAGTETAQAEPVQSSGGQPAVDESALRYFAARGDTARLNAEIARLRTLYPTWTPPENPLAVPENADRKLEEMWALYSQSRYPDVRAAIARRRQEEPQWTPPADLVERLEIAEKRAELVAASNAGRNEDVVRIGAATPSLLTCSDADVLWRVAEAFARSNRMQRARDAYVYMLDNCTDAAVRIATVQKATTHFGYTEMQDILSHEKTGPDGAREFDPIRPDLARRFTAEGNSDPKLTVAPAWLTLVEKLATDEGLASDALLLGWYHLRRDDFAAAEPWFRKARSIEDSASAAEGLGLVLLARKMPAEAEAALYAWRTSSDDAMQTYLAATTNLLALDPAPRIAPDILSRIAAVTMEERHPETGEQFGWYALAMDQPKTAQDWFAQVLRWQADYEPAAYGLGVSQLRLKDRAGLASLKRAWAGRSERIAALGERDPRAGTERRVTTEDALVAERRRPVRQIETFEEEPAETVVVARAPRREARQASGRGDCRGARDVSRLSPAGALSFGWCLMEINRPMEAAKAFDVALSGDTRTRGEAAYGQSLAYLRMGLTSDAAVSATKARLDTGRSAELQSAILADRALSSFQAKRYREALVYLDQRKRFRPEPTDLMVLRAYSFKNLGYRAEALRLFEALAETGHRDAIRALGDMRS